QAIHDHGLFDPLATGVIPVGQSIDHDIVATRLAQIERLDRHALDIDADGVALPRDREIEALYDLLGADRPADVGAEREPDPASDVWHVDLHGRPMLSHRDAEADGVEPERRREAGARVGPERTRVVAPAAAADHARRAAGLDRIARVAL